MKKLLRPVFAATENQEKPIFDIPVIWQMSTVMHVPATSLKAAVQIVNRQEFDLPDGKLVADSFEIDYDELESW